MTRRLLAMLLASLMLVSALPVYAVEEEAPAQSSDPWMDYAREHLGNTLPFMRQDELSFLEPGCQVYLGNRLSAYNAQLGELPYAMYPVFVDDQVIAIAMVIQTENGELSFQAGPQFAEQLNEFIADNANVALVMNEGSIQFINDEGETEYSLSSESSTIPMALSLTSDVKFNQVIPVTSIQEIPQVRAAGVDSGSLAIEHVWQGDWKGDYAICWAACMVAVGRYYNVIGGMETAMSFARNCGKKPDTIDPKISGATDSEVKTFFATQFPSLNAEYVYYPLSYDYVYNQTIQGKPLYAILADRINDSNRAGHSVVTRGCYISNGVVYYRIMNPQRNAGLTVVQVNSNGTFSLPSSQGTTMTQYAYFRFNP